MSARNWTPGPWSARLESAAKSGSVFSVVANGRIPVAEFVALGDAYLLAAAPALYEALTATPCTCTTVAGASHGGQTEQLLDEQCARCAALALADGGNHG